ncbi:hypothetical protein ACA910_017174 [Epithemia clementina (nom. ined.)]
MMMSCLNSSSLSALARRQIQRPQYLQETIPCSLVTKIQNRSRYVRVIAVQDLPHGKGYKGDIVFVKAGYARNYLYPQKYIVYATQFNFLKFGIKDPRRETAQEKRTRLAAELENREDQDRKAADLLRKYLSNKVVKLYRITPDDSMEVPLDKHGVDAENVKEKLSKQLKIDLEPHEVLCIRDVLVDSFEDFENPIDDDDDNNNDDNNNEDGVVRKDDDEGDGKPKSKEEVKETPEEKLDRIMREMGDKDIPSPMIRRLGNYYARIWLSGDYLVPLKFTLFKKP